MQKKEGCMKSLKIHATPIPKDFDRHQPLELVMPKEKIDFMQTNDSITPTKISNEEEIFLVRKWIRGSLNLTQRDNLSLLFTIFDKKHLGELLYEELGHPTTITLEIANAYPHMFDHFLSTFDKIAIGFVESHHASSNNTDTNTKKCASPICAILQLKPEGIENNKKEPDDNKSCVICNPAGEIVMVDLCKYIFMENVEVVKASISPQEYEEGILTGTIVDILSIMREDRKNHLATIVDPKVEYIADNYRKWYFGWYNPFKPIKHGMYNCAAFDAIKVAASATCNHISYFTNPLNQREFLQEGDYDGDVIYKDFKLEYVDPDPDNGLHDVPFVNLFQVKEFVKAMRYVRKSDTFDRLIYKLLEFQEREKRKEEELIQSHCICDDGVI